MKPRDSKTSSFEVSLQAGRLGWRPTSLHGALSVGLRAGSRKPSPLIGRHEDMPLWWIPKHHVGHGPNSLGGEYIGTIGDIYIYIYICIYIYGVLTIAHVIL